MPACEPVLGLADDALIASHRLSEWVARAPELEEDVALANIALDLLGQARLLLTHLGEGDGRTEDDLAFLRPAADFRNAVLLERPNGDFAVTVVRMLLLASYQGAVYADLAAGPRDGDRGDAAGTVAGIAAKAVKEVAYHRDHARLWTLRLGLGTAESHRRAQAAVDAEWPWFDGLLAGAAVASDPAAVVRAARSWAGAVLAEAALLPPPRAESPTGRDGRHTPWLDEVLAEMREVTAAHPGAQW